MNQSNPAPLPQDFVRWPAYLTDVFPLLTRELIEQSAKKRTFILRFIYAATVYGFVLWGFWNELGGWTTQSFQFLGRGHQLFRIVVALNFAGIYLFLPAMTSGVLTIEKERDTLGLLLLTRLGPWSILIGKLFSRLVPMTSFLLLSLPLVAVAYSLGGVEFNEILEVSWALMATSLQVGAMSLACSAWFRTTATAFMATYLIGAALIFGPQILTSGGYYDPFGLVQFLGIVGSTYGLFPPEATDEAVNMLKGPLICFHPSLPEHTLGLAILRSIPILLFSGACLGFARIVLWRRAFVQPSHRLMKLFRSLDGFFQRANQNRFTKGIVLTLEDVALPVFDPIRWRETKKRSLGTTRYLVRLLLVLETPVLFGAAISVDVNSLPAFVVLCSLWIFTTLVLVIQSTGLIGTEKSKQTLDVLLTVPMTSDAIVREKFAGIWRMIRMLWIPFCTVYIIQIWWSSSVRQMTVDEGVYAAVKGLLTMLIYPPFIAALGFHFGMRCRSQTQAVMVTLSVIASICATPILVSEILFPSSSYERHGLRWFSPVTVVTTFNTRANALLYSPYRVESWEAWAGLMVHFVFYGICLVWLWSRVLKTFAKRVGRNDGQIIDDDDIERLSLLRQKIVGGGVFRASHDE